MEIWRLNMGKRNLKNLSSFYYKSNFNSNSTKLKSKIKMVLTLWAIMYMYMYVTYVQCTWGTYNVRSTYTLCTSSTYDIRPPWLHLCPLCTFRSSHRTIYNISRARGTKKIGLGLTSVLHDVHFCRLWCTSFFSVYTYENISPYGIGIWKRYIICKLYVPLYITT